jgi:anaerobic magnesium-protoporphyrin IX monomethyl ester cyclase
MRPHLVLVRPPQPLAVDLGPFALGVLAASVRDVVSVSILDAAALPLDRAALEVWARRPSLVGVSIMDIAGLGPGAQFIQRLLATGPATSSGRAPVIAGGHGVTCLPDHVLAMGADAVVLGEGEQVLRRIVLAGLVPGEAGLAMSVGGRIVTGPQPPPIMPLDRLPSPARDLMPPSPLGIHTIETSRGCPHGCAFCETTRFHGRLWRPKSPLRVADEVRSLVEEHGAWVILIADDNFCASPARVQRICAELQAGELPAMFIVSARADDLLRDPDLLPAMAEARMLRVQVGIETLDGETAAAIGKPIGPEVYEEAFRRMRALGIFSVASLIVGLPGEPLKARAQAVERCAAVLPDTAVFLALQPMPGTPVVENGCLAPRPGDIADAARFTQAYWEHPRVRRNLARAARGSGVRALLAQAALREPPHRQSPLALVPSGGTG